MRFVFLISILTLPWVLIVLPASTTTPSFIVPSMGEIIEDPQLTISTSPSPSRIGQVVAIGGTFETRQEEPLARQLLLLQWSLDQRSWVDNRTVETNDIGRYALNWTPPLSGRFYVRVVSGIVFKTCRHIVADSVVSQVSELQNATKQGGVVFISEGTYDLHTALVLSSNLFLIGVGERTVLRMPQKRLSGILYGENLSKVHIAEVSFEGNCTPESFTGGSAIELWNSTSLTMESLRIANLDKEALVFNFCRGITITNSRIQKVWTGIVARDSKNVLIRENTINWTAGDGVYITTSRLDTGCANVTVDDNELSKIGDTGIDVSTPYNGASQDVVICNNVYKDYNVLSPSLTSNGIGITISHCTNVQVTGNSLSSSKGGLLVGIGVYYAEITNNAISKFSEYGIWIVSPTDVRFNTITDGKSIGIRINPSAGRFEISSNRISNVSTAIEWLGAAPKIMIRNNVILNPSVYGIYDGGIEHDYWTSGTCITNNTIMDTRIAHQMKYGVCQTSTRVSWVLGNNTISGAVIAPMYLASTSNVLG